MRVRSDSVSRVVTIDDGRGRLHDGPRRRIAAHHHRLGDPWAARATTGGSSGGSPAPPIAGEQEAGPPKQQATVILKVGYINLAAGAVFFELDDEGNASYYDGRHPEKGTRGHVAPASLDRPKRVTQKFCATKRPDTEPMTFVRIELSLAETKCTLQMSEQEWKPARPR